ncbi:MAG: phosphotransferase [Bacillota bacterium]
MLEGLPEGNVLCHGDLNLNNVILTAGGWKIIDWDNASLGNPLADVARSVLMLDAGINYSRSPEERAIIELVEPPARDAYVKRYLELSGLSEGELRAWRAPLAAARLCENIGEEEAWLLEVVSSALQD